MAIVNTSAGITLAASSVFVPMVHPSMLMEQAVAKSVVSLFACMEVLVRMAVVYAHQGSLEHRVRWM